jgi:hypothetical protein
MMILNLGPLYHVNLGSVADVLGIYTACIFRVEVSMVSQCS